MKEDKNEFEQIKEALKKIPEFNGLEIKESWFYDINRLEDEIKEKQKFLRVVKKERKLQPKLRVVGFNDKVSYLESGYQIGLGNGDRVFYCKDW